MMRCCTLLGAALIRPLAPQPYFFLNATLLQCNIPSARCTDHWSFFLSVLFFLRREPSVRAWLDSHLAAVLLSALWLHFQSPFTPRNHRSCEKTVEGPSFQVPIRSRVKRKESILSSCSCGRPFSRLRALGRPAGTCRPPKSNRGRAAGRPTKSRTSRNRLWSDYTCLEWIGPAPPASPKKALSLDDEEEICLSGRRNAVGPIRARRIL